MTGGDDEAPTRAELVRRAQRGDAKAFAELGIPCFGCTPKKLVALMEKVLSGGDLKAFVDAG